MIFKSSRTKGKIKGQMINYISRFKNIQMWIATVRKGRKTKDGRTMNSSCFRSGIIKKPK